MPDAGLPACPLKKIKSQPREVAQIETQFGRWAGEQANLLTIKLKMVAIERDVWDVFAERDLNCFANGGWTLDPVSIVCHVHDSQILKASLDAINLVLKSHNLIPLQNKLT